MKYKQYCNQRNRILVKKRARDVQGSWGEHREAQKSWKSNLQECRRVWVVTLLIRRDSRSYGGAEMLCPWGLQHFASSVSDPWKAGE